jgi:hypothetical protein
MISLTDHTPQAPAVYHSASGKPFNVLWTVNCPYFKISTVFISSLLENMARMCSLSAHRGLGLYGLLRRLLDRY